jgi:N-hydroxyarylamine O-acetyltransferase
MDVPGYLARIGYKGHASPNADTLRGLHRLHLLAVPFENLDIVQGRKIVLDENAILQKIVGERRGGFCYELNTAFAALLRALGFRVTMLAARVPRKDGSMTPEFDHLTLRVDLDGPWLADVGFGDSFMEPLLLRPGLEQVEPGERMFRISEQKNEYWVEKGEADGSWMPEYSFSLLPRELDEFAGMCEYHQTSPESPFTSRKLCTIATADGRVTLSNMRLIVTRNGQKEEREIGSEAEWTGLLRVQFGVTLPSLGATKHASDETKASGRHPIGG